jgi:type I restriction enzyme S subunit
MYPLKPTDGMVSGYLLAVILGDRFSKYAESVSVRSGMPKINRVELAEFYLPRPQTVEQNAIATALSDVDALIAGLEKLIAKKRDIKQATMQQLLTGHTRLPGFHGVWEVKLLEEVAALSKGTQLHESETDKAGRFAHLNGGITPSSYTHKSNAAANTIAISEGGNSCGFVQFMMEPYWCGGHCYSVIPNGVDNHFLYQALKGQQSAIMGLRVGAGWPTALPSTATPRSDFSSVAGVSTFS